MPKLSQFKLASVAAEKGTSMSRLARTHGIARSYLYDAIAGKATSARAVKIAGKVRASLGLSSEPIPYATGLCQSSTGLNLPIELHNFCRTEVNERRAQSISAMCVEAIEQVHGAAIRAYIAGTPSAKRHHLARKATAHAVVPKHPTSDLAPRQS